MERLSTEILVGALIRRADAEGGHATVLARGDRGGGAIVLACAEKGHVHRLIERVLNMEGRYAWAQCGPEEPEEFGAYLERRRQRDPDLWIVELDIAEAERFAAETIC